jgi:ABC-type transporter Mla subunit MlaD
MTDKGKTGHIAANIPALRDVSTRLSGVADDLAALLPELKEIEAAARKNASANTVDGSVSPIFSPLLASLSTVTKKVGDSMGQLHANVSGDAAALKKLADDIEGTDQDHGVKIAGIVTT